MSNRNSNRNQHGRRTKASVQCPFLKRNGHCLKGSRYDFSHNYVLPTVCEPNFQQNPIQRVSSFNIPQPDCYQVPFPFNPNYFPPIQHPMFRPFPYPHPSPLIPPFMSLPTRPPLSSINTSVLKKVHSQKRYDIPAFISTNVRKLDNKLDELQDIAVLNNAKVVCITETWLTMQVPDHIVAMPGYNLFRNDRTHTVGGAVCMFIHNSIPFKQLEECIEDQFKALWMLLRPHKLPRNITCIVAVVIYHTTSSREPENLIIKDNIQHNLDNLLKKYPNALVVPEPTGVSPGRGLLIPL